MKTWRDIRDAFKPKPLFQVEAPDKNWLSKWVGKTVLIDGRKVEIETIVGNKMKPNFFEINGKHLIGMLRFYAQMERVTDISEQEFLAFENMEHHVQQEKTKGGLIL